jgi:hypothetical protein
LLTVSLGLTGDGEGWMTRLPHYAAMLATAGQLPADDDRWRVN